MEQPKNNTLQPVAVARDHHEMPRSFACTLSQSYFYITFYRITFPSSICSPANNNNSSTPARNSSLVLHHTSAQTHLQSTQPIMDDDDISKNFACGANRASRTVYKTLYSLPGEYPVAVSCAVVSQLSGLFIALTTHHFLLAVHCLTAEDLRQENAKGIMQHFHAPENSHNRFLASLTQQERAILRHIERPQPYNSHYADGAPAAAAATARGEWCACCDCTCTAIGDN